MNWQALLLEPAVVTALIEGRSALLGRKLAASPAGILTMLAGCLALVAALALLAGGYLWLEGMYGPRPAFLIIGGSMALLSVLLLLGSWSILYRKKLRILAYQKRLSEKAEAVLSSILEEIAQPVQAYPKSAVSIAALAGYVAGGRAQEGTDLLIRTFERLKA